MENLIYQKLAEVEARNGVIIPYACESGSRAWGFASPDSDYDIRFIYQKPQSWYLSLWERKDVIEFMTRNDLDGSGWDIAKALRLLAKSNAPLLEWIYSPVVYRTDGAFLQGLRSLAADCFSPIACMHHYLSMTRNYLPLLQGDEIKLKHLFYALRTSLAGRWIVERQSIPPVAFGELLALSDTVHRERIAHLIDLKAGQDEAYLHPNEAWINAYLSGLLAFNEQYAASLPPGKKIADKLNEWFVSQISRSTWTFTA
jgi:hypothetical protein